MDYVFLAESLLFNIFKEAGMSRLEGEVYMAANDFNVGDVAEMVEQGISSGLSITEASVFIKITILEQYPLD